ncbi:MAG: type II secretion system protein GspK [Archangium sp.]|nr:type II secretion system protein GspK [Archangium sp.]MDP3157479.1 type II secretion system protein GspK [Archangium sp.]MDP3572766.1 type II secretion system protein GspK [Archangium sp.]
MRSGKLKTVSPRARKSERGIAMLLVLVGIAVLALVANEVRYNSIVELRLATNQRDELRAHYMAKSGIAMSRLMLRFQKQLDAIQIPNLGGMLAGIMGGGGAGGANPLAALLGGAGGANPLAALGGAGGAGALAGLLGGAGGAGGAGAGGGSMSIQLWKMAKIDCHMLAQMVPEYDEKDAVIKKSGISKKFDFDDENPELGKAQATRRFGAFTGCFDTVITDEEERINLNKLDAPQGTSMPLLLMLISTLGDKKYEFLFEKEDSNRVKLTPVEVITNFRDWVDEDETGSTLNLSGSGDPFLKGFSDENGGYVKYDPAYRAKNARFDSLDELFMVHGVNDRFMAAFKEKLTVYPNVNSRLNINTDDPVLLEVAIRSVADPLRPDPRMADPIFMDTLIKKIRAARVFALFGMSVNDFVMIVAAAGIPINASIQSNVQGNRFIGDKSTTYRVRVTGSAGDVTRTITAVVRLDDTLGRLVYWREE